MANYNNLKTAIQDVIKTNGNKEITGDIMQNALLSIINSLGAGYQFMGVATPETNPGAPDQKVFYIANGKGTYANFGGLIVDDDEVVLLTFDESWKKLASGIASNSDILTELESLKYQTISDKFIPEMRNGSVPNPGNVYVIAMNNVMPIGEYDGVEFITNRPLSPNCIYRYGYALFREDSGASSSAVRVKNIDYDDETIPNKFKIEKSEFDTYGAKGFAFSIGEYNTLTGQFNNLRVTDFEGFKVLCAYYRNPALDRQIVNSLNLKLKDGYSYVDVSSQLGIGSVQPDGSVDTASIDALVSDFIPIVKNTTIKIDTPEDIIYKGTTYKLRCRMTVLQKAQSGNTVYNMLKERVEPLSPVKIPDGDYHYLRFSLYITTDGVNLVSEELGAEIWANITQSFSISFNPSIFEKNYPLDQIDNRITELESKIIKTTDIVDLNDKLKTTICFKNLIRQYKGDASTTRKNLVLAHFSDLHGTRDNLLRILQYCNEYDSYIDDILCTGDVVPNSFNQMSDTEYNTMWNGAENVLFCTGNHDTARYTDTYEWTYYTGLPAYNRYFAPFISNWKVTQPSGAETNGYCYYYKDYTSEKVRLIVLDVMGYNSTQRTWFQNTLASAITDGLAVVCAIHYPAKMTSLNVSFDSKFGSTSMGDDVIPAELITDVKSFISNNGEFVCWLAGHTHRDFFGTLLLDNNQLCIAVDTASSMRGQQQFSNIERETGEKSQDLFNIFSVDTYNKRVTLMRVGADTDTMLRHIGTICYDYKNKELIWNQ